MSSKRLLAIIALGLVVLVAVAFGIDRWYAVGPGRAETYRVSVRRDGRELGRFTVPELEKLGVKTVVMQGRKETGPALLAVLGAAGVGSFSSVTISGLGVRGSGQLELRRDQVDDDVLLDVANRGTTKVCGPRIPYDSRVRDVTEIRVR